VKDPASRVRELTTARLRVTPIAVTAAEDKILLEDRIHKLEAARAEAKQAPHALDNLEPINNYTCEIKRLYERLAIASNCAQAEIPKKPQPDELEKSARRLEAQPDSLLYENSTAIRNWHNEQKWFEYHTKHGEWKKAIPFCQTERELSAAVVSDDPEAQTKITARIQVLEERLAVATDIKEQARLADQLAWAKAQQKINARMAKK
jgi:hypothetical protein